MKLPFLLFDFDGTLADSLNLGIKIINKLSGQYGIEPIDEETYDSLRSMSIPKAMQKMKIPLYRLPQAVSQILSEYKHLVHELQPFEGIKEMLEELKMMGCRMALLSSNTKENVQHFLEQHDLNYFEWVQGTSGALKKHRSITARIKKHKLSRSELIYVGDEVRDIIAAKKSGIRVIAVSWGFHRAELLASKDPDYLVDKPIEVVELVKRMIELEG